MGGSVSLPSCTAEADLRSEPGEKGVVTPDLSEYCPTPQRYIRELIEVEKERGGWYESAPVRRTIEEGDNEITIISEWTLAKANYFFDTLKGLGIVPKERPSYTEAFPPKTKITMVANYDDNMTHTLDFGHNDPTTGEFATEPERIWYNKMVESPLQSENYLIDNLAGGRRDYGQIKGPDGGNMVMVVVEETAKKICERIHAAAQNS